MQEEEPDAFFHLSNTIVSLDDIEMRSISNVNNEATPSTSDLPTHDEMELASAANGLHWAKSYRRLMDKSIRQAHHMASSRGWNLVEAPANCTSSLLLYESDFDAANYVKLKARGVFQVRPERLAYVIRDHNEETRSRWEPRETFVTCKQLETFSATHSSEEDIHVVRSEHKLKHIPFAWNRSCLGIQWHGFDKDTGVYKYVFRTTQHRIFRNGPKTIAVQGIVGVFIRILETKDAALPECDFTLVMHVNIGDAFPQAAIEQFAMKEWLRERVELYVRVAQQWDTYYKREDNPKTHRK